VEYAIVAFQDIGDRKLAAAQLQQSNEELLRANQLKDEFLANMSHELRTPLNAILGMTEALIEQIYGTVNDQQLKSLQIVETSGFHLLNLINDILDLAKIGAGQAEIECEATEVVPLCKSSLVFIQQQALQKGIQLNTEFPINSPILLIDERRISQVLINLLNNAIKFTDTGGNVTLAVREIEAHSGQKWLRLSVTDTGIGIAANNIPKLF
jgi:signal transduction histidine kinase